MADEIVFKKRSGRGSTRQKEKSPVRSTNDEESITPTLSYKEKQKAKKQPRRSNLSFGTTEETDSTFKPKKSLLSQSISNRQTSETPTSNYSQNVIEELKANTPTKGDIEISITDDIDTEDGYSDIAKRIYGDKAINDLKESQIPSDAAITAAKKKRQAGTYSNESDYISLSGGPSSSQALTLTGDTGGGIESRLQHEDDVFDDDTMGAYTGADESIHLTNQGEKDALRRQRRERGEMVDEVMDEASDEEQQAWEKAQAKRAMAGAHEEPANGNVYIPAPIPEITPLPTLNGAMKRLKNLRIEGEKTHGEKQKLSELSQKELQELSQSENEIRQQVEEVENRRSFFDDLRQWADEIASFLDEKQPNLAKIEQRHQDVMTERFRILNERRTTGNVVLNLEPHEIAEYNTARQGLKDDVKVLFEDVKASSFLNPSDILMEKFSAWRKAFGDDYIRAWAPLGMVSVWEFWTRVEVAGWDALRDSNKSIMSLKSYDFCHNYASMNDTEEDMQTEDEEAKLNMERECVPHLLSTIIIPYLITHFGNGGYDPYNETETRNALDLVEMVEGGLLGMDDEKLDNMTESERNATSTDTQEVSAQENERRLKDLNKSDKDTSKLLKKSEKDYKNAEKHLRDAEKAESQATKNIDKTMKEQQKAEKKKIDAEAQFNRANMFSDNAKKELDQAKELHEKRKAEFEQITTDRQNARERRNRVEQELNKRKSG
ncbi:hypothetical protein E3Q19_02825 [Wallemia mellicola]|nr:hypothetical protein E3Q19_02825 [Wallemia mellicola]